MPSPREEAGGPPCPLCPHCSPLSWGLNRRVLPCLGSFETWWKTWPQITIFHLCRLSGRESHCKKRHTVNSDGLWGQGLVPISSPVWKKVRQGQGQSTLDSCLGLYEFIHCIPGASVSNINSASFCGQLPPLPPARGLSTWIPCSAGCWQRHSEQIYRSSLEGFSWVTLVWRFSI